MGYSANGADDASLKKDINRDELRKVLDAAISKSYGAMEYDLSDTDTRIYFYENADHWHEEDTGSFLNALAPYITDGCAEYSGEEECNWRYILIDGEWVEQDGTIYYSTEDMIKKLESMGYTVSK